MSKPYFNSAELVKMGVSRPMVEALRYAFENAGNGVAILTLNDIENLMHAITMRNSEFDRIRHEMDEIKQTLLRLPDTDQLRRRVEALESTPAQSTNLDPLIKRIESLESLASWG